MKIKIIKEQSFIINLCKTLIDEFSKSSIKIDCDQNKLQSASNQAWLICQVNSCSFAIQAFNHENQRIRNSNLALGLSQITKCPIIFYSENRINEDSELMESYSFRIETSDTLRQISNFRIALSVQEEKKLRRFYNFTSKQRLLNLPRINQLNAQELSIALISTSLTESMKKNDSIILNFENLLIKSKCANFKIENFEVKNNLLAINMGAIMENDQIQLSLDLLNLEVSLSDLNKLTTGTKLFIDCPSASKAFLKIANSRFAEVNLHFTNSGIEMQIINEFHLQEQETFKSELR